MAERELINGKPVHYVTAKSIINFKSGFKEKLLCDGMTFTTGTACAFSCSFCYVPAIMAKGGHVPPGMKHSDVVVRRRYALEAMHVQLTDSRGNSKFTGEEHHGRVIYGSPLVDVAANMDLVRETVEVCKMILMRTDWHIRLLSKSNLLPKIAYALECWGAKCDKLDVRPPDPKGRIIYGVSTGTIDDRLAKVFEEGTPLVSKRIESLHWLQDNGYRTFGMICPSLPPIAEGYSDFAQKAYKAIRGERCEHIWAEVLNTRGDSTAATVCALRKGGYGGIAGELERIMADRSAWECYSRETFNGHAAVCKPGQLRYLQYVTKETKPWWAAQVDRGAVLLGSAK